jgi:hypothetical protein
LKDCENQDANHESEQVHDALFRAGLVSVDINRLSNSVVDAIEQRVPQLEEYLILEKEMSDRLIRGGDTSWRRVIAQWSELHICGCDDDVHCEQRGECEPNRLGERAEKEVFG